LGKAQLIKNEDTTKKFNAAEVLLRIISRANSTSVSQNQTCATVSLNGLSWQNYRWCFFKLTKTGGGRWQQVQPLFVLWSP
jgi:hypothetical protein